MNSVNIRKKIGENNPVIAQRFLADPYAIEYNGRVYVYGSNDSDSFYQDEDGRYPRNEYGNIRSLNCISSADLVNWTDHGVIQVAADKNKGVGGIAKWAGNSWAPAATYKTFTDEAGKEYTKFFLYFANSASSIGVLSADSPEGPFTDPLGKPLITRENPGCEGVAWMFDPAVLMDDDGNAYIYFGGGVPEGMARNPRTARVAKLGGDMISIDGEEVIIDAPYMFEDSGINKFGDTYYYSYCTNWSEEAGSAMGKAQIAYMTSKNPMGPFEYQGVAMKNPGQSEYFSPEAWGNNHHCMLQVDDQILMFYHTPQYELDMRFKFDMSKGACAYRTSYVDAVSIDDAGCLNVAKMTKSGTAEPLKQVNPFAVNPANSFVWGENVTTALFNNDILVKCDTAKGWFGIANIEASKLSSIKGIKVTAGANKNDCRLNIYINSIASANMLAEVVIPAGADTLSEVLTEVNAVPVVSDKVCSLIIEAAGLEESDSVLVKQWQLL